MIYFIKSSTSGKTTCCYLKMHTIQNSIERQKRMIINVRIRRVRIGNRKWHKGEHVWGAGYVLSLHVGGGSYTGASFTIVY